MKATVELGYPESTIIGIGVVLVLSTLLYLIPRTAIFGAVLLSGYLGGAVATEVRVSAPSLNILFPAVFGCLVWVCLYLRPADASHSLVINFIEHPCHATMHGTHFGFEIYAGEEDEDHG